MYESVRSSVAEGVSVGSQEKTRKPIFEGFTDIQTADKKLSLYAVNNTTGEIVPRLSYMIEEGIKTNKPGFANLDANTAIKSVSVYFDLLSNYDDVVQNTRQHVPESIPAAKSLSTEEKVGLFQTHKDLVLGRIPVDIKPSMMAEFSKYNF
jgi:hypothetical protein